MTTGDLSGDVNGNKNISGFYLENNMHVLFKNKKTLTDISKKQVNLKSTFIYEIPRRKQEEKKNQTAAQTNSCSIFLNILIENSHSMQ